MALGFFSAFFMSARPAACRRAATRCSSYLPTRSTSALASLSSTTVALLLR
jgi:hypothetical protein